MAITGLTAFCLLWPPYGIGQAIICLPCGFFLSFRFYSSLYLIGRRLDVYHTSYTWCGHSANLECRSEMCCTQLAGNAGSKKSPKIRHLRTIAQRCRAISLQLRHISTIRKNLLNSNISPRCLYNMVNFDLLAAEIVSLVWGTPANFNGFHVLAAILHGTLVLGVSETAALNRGRTVYLAGRPSRWALAYILAWDVCLLSSNGV